MRQVQESRFYSIMFDETSDVSGKNVMSFMVRIIRDNEIAEYFLGFFNVHEEAKEFISHDEPSITGIVLGKVVVKIAQSFGLDLKNCVSIGTDGAAVMTSPEKGAVQYIKSECSEIATHSYCLSHVLNLCVSDSINGQCADSVIKLINKCQSFFQFAKRNEVLMKHSASDKRKLKSCSKTRQIERLEAISVFKNRLKSIFVSLLDIEKWSDSISASKAQKLRMKIGNFDTVVHLVFLENIMKDLSPLAVFLQSKQIDLSKVLERIQAHAKSVESKVTSKNSLMLFNVLI